MHAPLSNNQEGRIILCHGCFDVLHLGHIRHLQEAAALGDRLVVSITSDEHAAHKGPGRPHFGEQHRREQLLALVGLVAGVGPAAIWGGRRRLSRE